MKRSILTLLVLLMACMALPGCIIIPWGHGHGHYDGDYDGDGHRGGGGGRGRR